MPLCFYLCSKKPHFPDLCHIYHFTLLPPFQAITHFCTSFTSVSLVLFPSPLNYVSHQGKQPESQYFTQAEKSVDSTLADNVLEMPGGAKRANTLKSTLRDITVKTDVPTHLKNPSSILKSRELKVCRRSEMAEKLHFQYIPSIHLTKSPKSLYCSS